MPKLKEWLFGKSAKVKQKKTTTPEQDKINSYIKEAIESGTGPLADIFKSFSEEDFQKNVGDPALANFNNNILPAIREKYLGKGQGLGSGIDAASIQGANQLQNELNTLRYNAQQQNQQTRAGAVQNFTGNKNVENIAFGASKGFLQGAAESAASEASKAGGKWLAG